MLIFVQKACFLGPTIFEIPQPNWYYKLHASLSVPLNGLKIEKGIYYILLPSTRKKGQNDGLPLSASDRPHDSWAKKDQKTCFSWNGHRIIKTESVKKINAVYITRSAHFFQECPFKKDCVASTIYLSLWRIHTSPELLICIQYYSLPESLWYGNSEIPLLQLNKYETDPYFLQIF